jgi:hypothetical protein
MRNELVGSTSGFPKETIRRMAAGAGRASDLRCVIKTSDGKTQPSSA